MIKFLENLLYQKTQGTQSEILFAQWNYDKKIIPVALNSISNLFPHYSLHDESHSITIINNIVRVLGKDKIENLSAIDIWLILEASYCHDIGMVVSYDKIIEALNSNEFLDFFKEIQQNKKNGLYDFSNQFLIENNKINYNSKELNLEFHDGIKYILAEFFRRKHADRSKEIIISPHEELNLTSPRGVIPQRIFKILGDICSCHTKNFDDVMNLSFCEVGIDVEDAHPRFIACLLRIGDLLDLDNNRFSEVMLRTLSKIPIDTLNHKSKHLSIESFRVDNELIEVNAKCKDYETASITQHWFNYLNSEISNQMNKWNTIVPYKDFGYLPTIGNLKVELLNYDYIDGKKKPKFSVDTDKALDLLQGAGIYEGAYQCFREILQNAVDATLIRIWLEYNEEIDFNKPFDKKFNEYSSRHTIRIEINEEKVIDNYKYWNITIEDKGIGISSYDLNFLMNTGSSSKNLKKANIIEKMPIWLKPSGIFGIGFQSIFMLTDQVNIETKSFFNEEFQFIELNSPNSSKDGDILIQRKKTNHKTKPGTKLSFKHKTKAIPERWSVKGEHSNAARIAQNYDPFSNDSLDVELGKVFDEIFDFSYKSPIKIELFINEVSYETGENESKFEFYDEENALELNVDLKDNYFSKIYYKNQKVNDGDISFDFLRFEINIHKDKASDVLTLNRNKIKPEYNKKLRKEVLSSAFRIITSNFEDIFKDDESKINASMFLNYYSDISDYLNGFEIKKFDYWKNKEIEISGKNYSLIDLIGKTKTLILNYTNNSDAQITDQFKFEKGRLTISLRGGNPYYNYTKFLLHELLKQMTIIEKHKDPNARTLVFSKDLSKSLVNDTDIRNIIISNRRNFFSSRIIIPCIDKYSKLRLNKNAYTSYVYHYRFDYNLVIDYPKMLSPFISHKDIDNVINLNVSLNDKLYEWVYENRFESSTTMEEIKKSYNDFIKEYDVNELNK